MSTSTEGLKQDLANHSSSSTPASQQTVSTINLNGTEKEDRLNEKSSEKKPDKPPAENNDEFSPPDGGWGWVVMIASMVLILLTDGIAFSVGTIYPTIRDDFKSESTKASLISALINAFSLLTGPVASVLADSYGHRVVVISGSILSGVAFVAASFSPNIDVAIVTYGFLAGTGFSLMYVSSVVVVGQYFERRRALAIGIASSGSGIGIFLISAITGALLNVISWRTVSLIEAALMILGILSGLTLHPLPKSNEDKEKISKRKLFMKRLDITLFKMPAYNTICMVFILATIGCILPYMYIPDVAQELNIESERAAFLLSITGITNTVSRMLCGFVVYRFPILSPVLLLAGICGIGGIVSFFVFLFTTYHSLAIYAAIVGFVYAADAALTPLVLIEIVGYSRLNSSVGFMCMFRGFPILIAGPIGGELTDCFDFPIYMFHIQVI
ncbi:monocarboxylate transporter 12-like [Octopus bimaculoides]|uniref:monocarboxylate transporter 12-like n=1 Tax=Octopus bimaculoides TaxID=37653 RepID=UPI0022E168A2|nr:monocarboxylate transporter 12-like [Octopus bimaculoides]